MLFLRTSFPSGFRGLVFCVLVPSVRRIRVVLQFCTVLLFPVPLSVILMVALFLGNLLFATRNPYLDAFFYHCIDSIDPSVPTLLCGDFNTVPDRFIDRHGSCPFDTSRESSNLLSVFFRDCCVVDIWRLKHPGVSGFTWSKRDGSLASRIDLVGCPYPWISFVSSADILPCPYSNHSALHLSWSLSPVSPLA